MLLSRDGARSLRNVTLGVATRLCEGGRRRSELVLFSSYFAHSLYFDFATKCCGPASCAIHLLGVLGDGRAVGGLQDLAVLEAAAKLGEAGEAAGGARARDCRRARRQGSVSQQSHTHAFEVNSAHPRRRSGARTPRHSRGSAAATCSTYRWTWPSTCSTRARPCTNDPLATESRSGTARCRA